MAIVDIDRPGSWTADVLEIVERAIDRAPEPEWREDPFDHFGWEFDSEEIELRHEMRNDRLVGYHATRLLPHEIASIRSLTGLEVLTEELRLRKVIEAEDRYPEAFSDDPNGTVLMRSGPNDWQGTADVRLGSIDFVAPFRLFELHAGGLMNLLDTWGGETLGWTRGGRGENAALVTLTDHSEPSIVEFAARVPTLNTYTPLLPAFAGALEQVSGDYTHQWRTSESIPPEFVLDILTPDSGRWPDSLDEYR